MVREPGKNRARLHDDVDTIEVISNACATIALLNIVMNIPNADIGDVLASLKDFTKDMSPYHRGYTIGNHEHIRNAHNSFVRHVSCHVTRGVRLTPSAEEATS